MPGPLKFLKTRLAPTPSGYLHPGNGLSFILTWSLARAAGGQILLRIDDLDQSRRRREYIDDIFYTLEWLQLDYDEGPSGVKDFLKNFSQQTRLDLYMAKLRQLREQGDLYACTCTRRQINALDPGGLYPGTCRNKDLPFDGPRTAWRIRLPQKLSVRIPDWKVPGLRIDLNSVMGDFVVLRKDRIPAYQVASLADDLHFGINFIVRGEDLLASSAAQLFLAQRLGDGLFSRTRFWHHPLLKTPDGEKLSKSSGAGSLKSWRETGRSPKELYREAGKWLGLDTEEIETPDDLKQAAGSVFGDYS